MGYRVMLAWKRVARAGLSWAEQSRLKDEVGLSRVVYPIRLFLCLVLCERAAWLSESLWGCDFTNFKEMRRLSKTR